MSGKRKAKGGAAKDAKRAKTGYNTVKKPRGPPVFVPAPAEDRNAIDSDAGSLEGDALQQAETFLSGMDLQAISKSRKTVKEEWRRNKVKVAQGPTRTSQLLSTIPSAPADDEMESDDLAYGSGDSDDSLSVMSNLSEDEFSDSELDSDLDSELGSEGDLTHAYDDAEEDASEAGLDVEDAYAQKQAQRRRSPLAPAKAVRLPLKLPNGDIQRFDGAEPSSKKRKVVFDVQEDEVEAEDAPVVSVPVRMDPLGTRFGRMGVRSILELPSKQERLMAARQEMAALSGDIMADPENNLNFIKRLLAFCGRTLSANKHDEGAALPIDPPIRALALLSMLAVLLDIIPAYRIRELNDAERKTKVSQAVARQRDYENGLVAAYKRYLELCEAEVDQSTPLKSVGLKCLCDLVRDKSGFNFSINIMDVIARQVSRAEWDEASVLCLETIIHIFETDSAGTDSLHLLRLLSRTIKSRSFKVHPALIASFLHLPLSSALSGVRASGERSSKDHPASIVKRKLDRKKQGDKPYFSKKARKAMEAKKEVEKEFAEAELAVSSEDLQSTRTETLKNLFALYFRVLKLDRKTELLSPALEGLAAFAHLINIDFFKDLLAHLKALMSGQNLHAIQLDTRERLLCIVTAFQLLSGQGEALNFDLADFVGHLYSILIPLSASVRFEDKASFESAEDDTTPTTIASQSILASEADLLFKAIEGAFITTRIKNSPSRMLIFAKRLLTCALQWPTETAIRTIDVVRKMLVKEPALESMLSVEDSMLTGVYNGMTDEMHLVGAEATVWWELVVLQQSHFDERVRDAAERLAHFARNH